MNRKTRELLLSIPRWRSTSLVQQSPNKHTFLSPKSSSVNAISIDISGRGLAVLELLKPLATGDCCVLVERWCLPVEEGHFLMLLTVELTYHLEHCTGRVPLTCTRMEPRWSLLRGHLAVRYTEAPLLLYRTLAVPVCTGVSSSTMVAPW